MILMKNNFEVAVVGANVAGSSMSYNLAKRGVKVVLLELLPSEEIGSISCGDGLDVHEFKRLGLEVPTGDFVYGDVIRGEVIAPNGKAKLSAQGKIKAVHRYHFCQYLKDKAVSSGAELIAPARAIAPIIKNNQVMGLKYRKIKVDKDKKKASGAIENINCHILVDASGLRAVIRNQLPNDWWVTEKIDKNDIAVCYKESRVFDKPLARKFIHGYFSSSIAPGGFYWIATRSKTLVNVGLGINLKYQPLSPKQQLYNEILPRHKFLTGSKIKWKGGGMVPRRRPLECMVANGFIAAGDAASMVNPMSGGGIGPSVFAGKLGGKVIPLALDAGDYSLETLWSYNFEYNTVYGPVQAGNYILRKFLEDLSDDQINTLLGVKLFSEKEIIEVIESGNLELGFLNKLRKLGKLAKYPRLLLKLRTLYKNMETARKLHQEYPKDISDFLPWRTKARGFFNKI
jgi:digeranylgeranylglycerophospholipid reductase